jgi:Holliday junction resolvase RusA-like endonuclease
MPKLSVAIPFDWGWSKNKMWKQKRGGGYYMNPDTTDLYNFLFYKIRSSKIPSFKAKEKIYISIYAELENHRGDALNLVDTICDAVKQAILVDDRWFAIKSLDWEIKKSGKIFIDIEQ